MGNCLSRRKGSMTVNHSPGSGAKRLESVSDLEADAVTNTEFVEDVSGKQLEKGNSRPSSSSPNDSKPASNSVEDAASTSADAETVESAVEVATVVDDKRASKSSSSSSSSSDSSGDEGKTSGPEVALIATSKEPPSEGVTLRELSQKEQEEEGYTREELFAPTAEDSSKDAPSTEGVGNADAAGTEEEEEEVVGGGEGHASGSGVPLLIVTDVSASSSSHNMSSETENQSRSLSLTNQFHDGSGGGENDNAQETDELLGEELPAESNDPMQQTEPESVAEPEGEGEPEGAVEREADINQDIVEGEVDGTTTDNAVAVESSPAVENVDCDEVETARRAPDLPVVPGYPTPMPTDEI